MVITLFFPIANLSEFVTTFSDDVADDIRLDLFCFMTNQNFSFENISNNFIGSICEYLGNEGLTLLGNSKLCSYEGLLITVHLKRSIVK